MSENELIIELSNILLLIRSNDNENANKKLGNLIDELDNFGIS